MRHESLGWRVVSLVTVLLLAAWWTAPAVAQETPPAGASEQPAAAAPEANAPKKPRGRLPAYYGKVVTDKQREQIYDIQTKFTEQIAKLQEQLESLVQQRDTEVAKVLTDDQRAEIARLKSDRKSRRSSETTDSAPAPNGG